MVKVTPYHTTWAGAHLIQRLGFLTAVLAQLLLLHFVLPYFDLNFLPKLDHSFQIVERTKFQESFRYKASYDIFLVGLFFLQHSIMSRKGFKETMNTLTGSQYYFLEKPLFILMSAFIQIYMVLKY